jgi:hypothetical protein
MLDQQRHDGSSCTCVDSFNAWLRSLHRCAVACRFGPAPSRAPLNLQVEPIVHAISHPLACALVAWAFTGQRNDAVTSRFMAKLRGTNRLPFAITLLVLLGLAGSLLPLMC